MTGYRIGDDSPMHKRRGKQMQGLGTHEATTERRVLNGRRLVQALAVVAGRRCPLAPPLYRHQAVCTGEGVPLPSKVALMAERIRGFAPAAATHPTCCSTAGTVPRRSGARPKPAAAGSAAG